MNLYLRLLKTLWRILCARKQDIFAPARVAFRVWPHDCDLNFHMNNGRYLTFMDLGRIHLLGQVGLVGTLLRRRWAPVLGAAEVSFIRPLPPLRKFELITRLLGWDEKYFYIEQRFESRGRLCAVAQVKGLFLHGGAPVANETVLGAVDRAASMPPLPETVTHWNALLERKKRARP